MSSDLFSKQASIYSQFRPTYPQALYGFILEHCANRDLAWDCATGNGQAAIDLSPHFKKVIATDLSQNQIEHALPRPNIEYRVLRAEEKLPVSSGSIDLITVAQALHWFDLDSFYSEAKRLLKPNGVFATWAYGFHAPISKEIDTILSDFYFITLGKYWKPNNRLIWEGYKDLPFPFKKLETLSLKMEVRLSANELLSYFRSWSATQAFKDSTHVDPTIELQKKLSAHWIADEKRNLSWDLTFLAGEK